MSFPLNISLQKIEIRSLQKFEIRLFEFRYTEKKDSNVVIISPINT